MGYPQKVKDFLIRKIFKIYGKMIRPESDIHAENKILVCIHSIPFFGAPLQSIANYPFMDKSMMHDYFVSLKKRPGMYISHTSGTTGQPISFYRDIHSIAAEQRFLDLYAEWSGMVRLIVRGEKFISPDEDPDEIFLDFPLTKTIYLSSYHLCDCKMTKVIALLQKKKNLCLWAYPSTASYIADYCLRKNLKIPITKVVLSSETLTDTQAEQISQAFGCRIYDWYGQAERVAALYRCEAGHYHIPMHYAQVEFIPSGNGIYEIVGTTLHNHVMPIVRYKTGDLVELCDGPCSCGRRDTIVVKKILGRSSEVIHHSGRLIPECVAGCTLKEAKHVRNFQILIQKNGSIRYDIVPEEGFCAADEKLVHKLISDVFPVGSYEVSYVSEIPKTENGKQRMVVHEI